MNKQTNLLAALLGSMIFAATALAGSADLKIAVTVTPQNAKVGDTIKYHCVVTNLGPDTPSSLHGSAGPDNHDGGCVPGNPLVSCDKYTNFKDSNPKAFFTDSTNFRYFHLIDSSGQTVSTLASGDTGYFDLFYTATADGVTQRLIGGHSDDQNASDPVPNNNDTTVTFTIGGSGNPTPPPHGGLSDTTFKINGSGTPSGNVADTVLRFSAVQVGAPQGLKVRVQATRTPDTESSWNDLANGRAGRMTLDVVRNQFVLNSTDYPLENGVYFRAVSSASGYHDSISNRVGPFNLVSAKPHLPPTKLFVFANSEMADLYFRATVATVQNGVGLRVQASTTPADESSWTDLNNGNAGHMTQSTRQSLLNDFLLLVNNYPAAQKVYFRAIASVTGSVDSLSQAVGSFGSQPDVPPDVTLTPPDALAGSGDGTTSDKPILVTNGLFSFGATAQSSGPVKHLSLLIDGVKLKEFQDGDTFGSVVTLNIVGDHVLEAYAESNLGSRKRLGAILFIRIVPKQQTRPS